jgi:hypothetical protein
MYILRVPTGASADTHGARPKPWLKSVAPLLEDLVESAQVEQSQHAQGGGGIIGGSFVGVTLIGGEV